MGQMKKIPAISILQPWASLIAGACSDPLVKGGAKEVETRNQPWHYTGPIAIHASKGFAPSQRQFCLRAEVIGALLGGHRSFYAEEAHDIIERLPRGAIIAFATLRANFMVGQQHPGPPLGSLERLFGSYLPGRGMLWLQNIRPLANPYPISGQQGLWTATLPAELWDRLLPPIAYFGKKSFLELPD